jgi:hypothetical protein
MVGGDISAQLQIVAVNFATFGQKFHRFSYYLEVRSLGK